MGQTSFIASSMVQSRARRMAAILAVFTLLLSASPAFCHILVRNYGDADNDGAITLLDARIGLQAMMGMGEILPSQIKRLDVSPMPGIGPDQGQIVGDGQITLDDIWPILRRSLGMPSEQWPDASNPRTYSWIQRNVFSTSCGLTSCHSESSQQQELNLEVGHAWQFLVNRTASTYAAHEAGKKLVVPGHPEQSFLLSKLTQPDPGEGRSMPFGQSRLRPEEIEDIRGWIADGAKPDLGDVLAPPDNFHPGDIDYPDATLEPPPPGQGFQVSLGPFPTKAGEEVHRNYFFKLPSGTPLQIVKIEATGNYRIHHWNLDKRGTPAYPKKPTDTPDPNLGGITVVMDGETTQPPIAVQDKIKDKVDVDVILDANGWEQVFGTGTESIIWQAPEGYAYSLKAGQEVCLNLHYLNQVGRRVPNGRGKLVMNFWTLPPDSAKLLPIESGFGGLDDGEISIPAKSTKTYQVLEVAPSGARLLSLTPHFHQWGKHFIIYRWTKAKTKGEVLAEMTDWDDPSYVMLDPYIDLQPGEGLLGEATYQNDSGRAIFYNNDVTKGEHMAMVGTFIPLPGKKTAYFNRVTVPKGQ